MWDIETRIAKHEKSIKVLDIIQILNNRILRHSSVIENVSDDYFGMKTHYSNRIKKDKLTKIRLETYYNNLIKQL